MMALLAPVIGAGMRADMAGLLQLSRALTFQSLSLAAIALYVAVLAATAVLVELVAGPYARLVEIGCVFRSEEHTSELQSLMRISYAVFCLKKKKMIT